MHTFVRAATRTFKVTNFTRDMIPDDATAVEIRHDYLVYEQLGVERSLQELTSNGQTHRYYLERPSGEGLDARDRRHLLSPREYRKLRGEKDPRLTQIHMMCYEFDRGDQHFKIEVHENHSRIVLLGVTVGDPDADPAIPEEFDVFEVTNDRRFLKRSIASGVLG